METRNPYLIPISILLAGAIIGGAVLLKDRGPSVATNEPSAPAVPASFAPIAASDHILGNPNASVKLIEYSDMECPYCKRFHTTLKTLMSEYGTKGELAWVYRHFPLDIHPKAQEEAHAAECVGELGGTEKFWQFLDRIYEITPSNNGLDLTLLEKTAVEAGVNAEAFKTCQASGKYKQKIALQLEDAINSGGRGTPWSILITKSGKAVSVDGALPYEDMKAAIADALKN